MSANETKHLCVARTTWKRSDSWGSLTIIFVSVKSEIRLSVETLSFPHLIKNWYN